MQQIKEFKTNSQVLPQKNNDILVQKSQTTYSQLKVKKDTNKTKQQKIKLRLNLIIKK